MKNKVLVYDTSGGYKRFIKTSFSNEFDCTSFFDCKVKEDINYDDFIAVFLIVNDVVELVDMLMIYKKATLVFFGSPIVQISDSLKELDDMIFLDLQIKRPEMIDFIKYNLRLSVINKDDHLDD